MDEQKESRREVTLKGIAKACAVSVTAVSLVLNRKECHIPKSTQEHIRQVATALNYHPNPIARSLATRKTNTIGVIIPDITNAFFAGFVRTLQMELTKAGYIAFIGDSEEKYDNDVKYIQLFTNRKVDGLILALSAESLQLKQRSKLMELLAKGNIPHVFFDRILDQNAASVAIDNVSCSREVIHRLMMCGHRDIGIITGPLALSSTEGRLKGVKDALAEAGLTLPRDHLVTAGYDIQSGREAANTLFGKVTAIFAFNDLLAYGVLEAARRGNVQIPKDISLVGFDDLPYSSLLETRLSSVRQPLEAMAIKSCELLMGMIEDKTMTQSIRFPGVFMARESIQIVDSHNASAKGSEAV